MKHSQAIFQRGKGWEPALSSALDGPQTLVLVFGAKEYGSDTAPLEALKTIYPRAVFAGCSTAGEVSGACISDQSISVAVVQFEHTRIMHAITAVSDAAQSFEAGTRLAQLLAADDLCAMMILSDGTTVNGTALVAGIQANIPPEVSLFGGLAGDGDRFQSTWVLDGCTPRAGHVSAVGFYGKSLQVGHGCDHGWSDFGPERRVTTANGNVLHALDGQPALDLYKKYLGDLAQDLPGSALLFPLSIRRHPTDPQPLVRTILGIDEDQQTMTFAGDIPEGAIARLMRANDDKLIHSASTAISAAMGSVSQNHDAVAISVSCVGRRLVLGERAEEEAETLMEGAPAGIAHVGFYSYGEISPSLRGGMAELHNQTMTVTVLSESRAGAG